MAQLHGPRRNSAMEPVFEPAVAERAARCPPGRLFLPFARSRFKEDDLKLRGLTRFQASG
jgi:hypothetical protein